VQTDTTDADVNVDTPSCIDMTTPEHGEDVVLHKLLSQIVDVDLLDPHLLCLAPDRIQLFPLSQCHTIWWTESIAT